MDRNDCTLGYGEPDTVDLQTKQTNKQTNIGFTHHDVMTLHLRLLTGQLVTFELQAAEEPSRTQSAAVTSSLVTFHFHPRLLPCRPS